MRRERDFTRSPVQLRTPAGTCWPFPLENSSMPKSDSLENAKSNNPRWLDTARLFYADSFGALRLRELRGAREDWSDLSDEEQTFALAHLEYLQLMAQAGTQRLLVQIRDALEEIADAAVSAREAGEDEGVGQDDSAFDDEPNGDEGSVAPPTDVVASSETAGEEHVVVDVDENVDDAHNGPELGDNCQGDVGDEESEDGGGRAA
jgi:hypothetical protein